MALCESRRGIVAALATVILAGCSSRTPFSDLDDAGQPDGAALAAATPPSPNAESSAGAAPEHPPPVLDENANLDAYLEYAALSNPGLEAKFQDWKAAAERLPQVRAFPDPRFTYGYYISAVETRAGPMQHAFSLSQTFPWLGKLRDREDAAARDANAAYQRFEAARLDLSFRVERAYNELFFLKQSIDITGENIELLQQFERVARARYRVAAAGHPDLIKIQVELGALEDRLRQQRDLRDPYAARLNAALNRPPYAAIPWPRAVSERVTDDDIEVLYDTLRARSPELIALQEEIERERIGAAIAKKDGLPDLTVGLAYTVVGSDGVPNYQDNGQDAVLATFSVNVPLWRGKYDAGVREAVARRLAAAGRRGDAANRLASDLQEALFEHRDARRRVELYRDTLIPKAEESLSASLVAFEQGRTDFLDLVDTQRTLLEFQLAMERALIDRATSYARIESLVGANLTEIHTTDASPEDTP